MIYFILWSTVVCHHLRSCDNHHPADDISNSQVSWYVEQCPRVYETAWSAQGSVGASYGLRCIHVGHDKGPGHRQGKSGQASLLWNKLTSVGVAIWIHFHFLISCSWHSFSVNRLVLVLAAYILNSTPTMLLISDLSFINLVSSLH